MRIRNGRRSRPEQASRTFPLAINLTGAVPARAAIHVYGAFTQIRPFDTSTGNLIGRSRSSVDRAAQMPELRRSYDLIVSESKGALFRPTLLDPHGARSQ